ncbi:hypothetical protein [Clostridium sp. DJ247]|nr:hypothetical protein [Clostridium sp. DJ247]
MDSIVFWYNDDKNVYEVKLEGEDINRNIDKIYENVEAIKQINN